MEHPVTKKSPTKPITKPLEEINKNVKEKPCMKEKKETETTLTNEYVNKVKLEDTHDRKKVQTNPEVKKNHQDLNISISSEKCLECLENDNVEKEMNCNDFTQQKKLNQKETKKQIKIEDILSREKSEERINLILLIISNTSFLLLLVFLYRVLTMLPKEPKIIQPRLYRSPKLKGMYVHVTHCSNSSIKSK